MIREGAGSPSPLRRGALAGLALLLGLGIAWVDTRPRWDDTGVTAGALLLGSCAFSLSGLPSWMAPLLVAAPLLLVEGKSLGVLAPLPLAFAACGGLLGAFLRRRGAASGPTRP